MPRKQRTKICQFCKEPIVPGEEDGHDPCTAIQDSGRKGAQRPRRQMSDAPPGPYMTKVVQVPSNPIKGLGKVNIEDLQMGEPVPEDQHTEEDGSGTVDTVLEQILQSTADPSPSLPEPTKESEEEVTLTMIQQLQPPTNKQASSFLRNLAQTAKVQRAAYLARLTDIPTSVIILAEEVLPGLVTAREEEDQERIKTILDGLQQAKNEHPELASFIDLHNRMQATKDPGLKIDFNRILETAEAMQAANEVRNSGGGLDDVQRDVLKSNLDDMAKKAMEDYNARLADAEKQRKRTAAQAYKDVEDMATHKSILGALAALEAGGRPIILTYIGENMPVPGLPSEKDDGTFPLKTLGSRALAAWELRKDGEATYRAYLKGQWGELCFDKHIDPAVGEPGVFGFDLEFSLKTEKSPRDPFHAIRFICGKWVRAERIAREKETERVAREEALREAFQPYRDGAAPVLTVLDFLVEQKGGIFYTKVRFAMEPKQPQLHLEAIFQREEKDGGVSLVAYTTETTHQDLEDRAVLARLGALQGQLFVAKATIPENKIAISCEPVGLRKALLKIPNDQKARLANLMRNFMRIEVQQETLREMVESLDSHRIAQVAKIALERNVFSEKKQHDEVQKMTVLLVGPCALLRRALWRVLQNELAAARQQSEPEQTQVVREETSQQPEPEPVAANPN